MSEKLKDILSHLDPEIDQELLLQYVQGTLSPEKQHEIEKQLLEESFESEAVEGLQAFGNKEKLSLLVHQLNKDLKKKTSAHKSKLRKKELRTEPWLMYAVIIFLLLIVLSYFIILRMQQG